MFHQILLETLERDWFRIWHWSRSATFLTLYGHGWHSLRALSVTANSSTYPLTLLLFSLSTHTFLTIVIYTRGKKKAV